MSQALSFLQETRQKFDQISELSWKTGALVVSLCCVHLPSTVLAMQSDAVEDPGLAQRY